MVIENNAYLIRLFMKKFALLLALLPAYSCASNHELKQIDCIPHQIILPIPHEEEQEGYWCISESENNIIHHKLFYKSGVEYGSYHRKGTTDTIYFIPGEIDGKPYALYPGASLPACYRGSWTHIPYFTTPDRANWSTVIKIEAEKDFILNKLVGAQQQSRDKQNKFHRAAITAATGMICIGLYGILSIIGQQALLNP